MLLLYGLFSVTLGLGFFRPNASTSVERIFNAKVPSESKQPYEKRGETSQVHLTYS